MVKLFHGGVHPPDSKEITQSEVIEALPLPKRVVVPMSMHLGAPANPLVKVGDEVRTGQKIGQADAFISAVVHSPITGVVKAIEEAPHPVNGTGMAVIIERQGDDDLPDFKPLGKNWEDMEPQEIIALIKDAGIVGMGGAAFPTHVKLSPPPGKKIERLIINGAECEPYLTSDDRVMRERPNDMLEGIRILVKATGVESAILGIEDNKHLAIKAVKKALESSPLKNILDVKVLKTHYPQGSEKQLIYALTGKEVPSGGLPIDVGVVVQNTSTAVAVFEALTQGKPLIERVVTLSGDAVKTPGNYLVRIGMTTRDFIEAAGGTIEEPRKVISGGPMMGIAQYTLDAPITKGTSGILLFKSESVETPESGNCIRCSFCINACPQKLMPQMLVKLAKKERWSEMKYEYNMMDCMECGSCTYACPAKIPVVQWVRLGKNRSNALKI
jgi:Na+-translocating ferredoxin:NAD+ oxidoreductase subunit C